MLLLLLCKAFNHTPKVLPAGNCHLEFASIPKQGTCLAHQFKILQVHKLSPRYRGNYIRSTTKRLCTERLQLCKTNSDSTTSVVRIHICSGCTPLVIEAQMHQIPHAAERTIVRIHVVDNLVRNTPSNSSPASMSNPLQGKLTQDFPDAHYTPNSTGVQKSEELLRVELHAECGRLVKGDVRPPFNG